MENITAVEASNSVSVIVRRSERPSRCPVPPKKVSRPSENAAALEEPEQHEQMTIEEPEANTSTSFESLPVELVMDIISRLSHSDLKEARRVCYNWNSVISAHTLVKKLSYTIHSDPSSLKTLHSSTVPWEHLHVKNCDTSNKLILNLPSYMKTILTTLTISECNFTWSWLLAMVQQVESLQMLTLQMCNLVHSVEMVSSGSVPDVLANRPLIIRMEGEGFASTTLFLKRLVNSSHFSRASFEICILEGRTESGFSRKLSLTDEEKAVVEMSKIVSACKLIRSVRTTVRLTIGDFSLDGCHIESEDGQKLLQIQRRVSRRLNRFCNTGNYADALKEFSTFIDLYLCVMYLDQFK